jgi:hypothetical protein
MGSKYAISLTEDNYKALKKEATKRGVAMSVVVNEIIHNVFLDGVKPVMFLIPKELMKKRSDFSAWLNRKSEALLNYWCPNNLQ